MKRIVLVLSTWAVAGCSSGPGDKPRLDLYDSIDMLRARYDAALNARDYTEQARIEVALTREAGRSFDMLMRDCAEEKDVRRRLLATFVLGFSKRQEAGLVLTGRLDDLDPEVRVHAAVGVANLRLPNPPVERVKQMLDAVNPRERHAALAALRLMLAPGQDAGLAPRLVGLLDDTDPDIKVETILVMGRVRKFEFLEPLSKKAFRDPFWLVRYNAAIAVGSYGSLAEVVVPPLIELLRDFEAPVVEAAHWALRQVTGRDFDRSYHNWRDWNEEERPKYEYFCLTDTDVVQPTAGFCSKCGAPLHRRFKPLPKEEEKKGAKVEEKKEEPK